MWCSENIVKEIRKIYKKGDRVCLAKMDDAMAPPVGTMGTVSHIDDTGTIHIIWDNGCCLGAVFGTDIIEIIR